MSAQQGPGRKNEDRSMAIDMKDEIVDAAVRLLLDRKKKKLTVKDIVEECHITRQTFYYHFEDIPHLLRYISEKGGERLQEEFRQKGDIKEVIRYFLVVALNIKPYYDTVKESNYAQEIEKLLKEQIYELLDQIFADQHMFEQLSQLDRTLLIRYNCSAIIGILQDWTDEDTKNLDQIVDAGYRMIMGEITPYPQGKKK